MKIQLKRIEFSERLSDETNAFTADLWINGKKVGYCKNDGQGGCTNYNGYTSEDNKVIVDAEKHFKALPKVYYEKHNFHYQPTLENSIDEFLENWLLAKEKKKFENSMKKQILVGISDPNRMSYSSYNFKRLLSTLPKDYLQRNVDNIVSNLKKGEVILNTNLKELGIIY